MIDNLSSPKSVFPFEPLPASLELPKELVEKACPWLDKFVTFSRKWSPRSYDGYFESLGLWVLSTIAARRIRFDFGKSRYTNLQIILIGRTSITAKSSAAQIAKDALKAAGLDWLLLPVSCTPQKLINLMTAKVPENYQELTADNKKVVLKALGFAGQRGWYYDEFGSLIQGMMNSSGVMVDFRSFLRVMDDCEDDYSKATIVRGMELIKEPYLALLGCLTPADLAPHVKKGSTLWGDGFLARMALVTPPIDFIKEGEFPKGERCIPDEISLPLKEWHEKLKLPKVEISGHDPVITRDSPMVLTVSDEVLAAYYLYDNFLRETVANSDLMDLDGNYTRLPEKAFRIAALFASLGDSNEIELHHWAGARRIAENWRMGLHDLYHQLTTNVKKTTLSVEDKVFRAIKIKYNPTSREIQQFCGLKSDVVEPQLQSLIKSEKISVVTDEQVVRYVIRDTHDDPSLLM